MGGTEGARHLTVDEFYFIGHAEFSATERAQFKPDFMAQTSEK